MPNNNIIPNNKFILVKGDENKWYDHIIFIAKNESVKVPVDFIAEAEKIVDNYFNRHNALQKSVSYYPSTSLSKSLSISKKKSKKYYDIFLYSVMLIGCIALAVIFLISIK